MKFLLISPFTSASGSGIRFWNIALQLKRAGHTVVFVDRKAPNHKPLFESEAIDYHSCKSSGNLIIDMVTSFLFNVMIFIRHSNCDVFYAFKPAPNNCIVALIAGFFGKKLILDVDDLDYEYISSKWIRKTYRVFFDFLPSKFPLVTYHTFKLKEYLTNCAKVPNNNLYYLAQGISQDFLNISPHDYESPPKSIIYVATLGITSDFGDIIPMIADLCRKDPDIRITIVGEGCRKTEFQNRVGFYNVQNQIVFKGQVSHTELPALIAQHQVGLNYMRPSKVNHCRAILKIREYLACGLNVVCNDVGDVDFFREYIHVEQDIEKMRGRIEFLLHSVPTLTNTKGRCFIKENYNWEEIVGNFLENTFSVKI